MTEERLVRLRRRSGIPADRLTAVKGFYEHCLTQDLKERFLPRKAAAIYIDCDLYQSTVPAPAFSKDFLQRSTLELFPRRPERGERRAWREFQNANPELRFEPFVQTGMQMSFIHLGPSCAE